VTWSITGTQRPVRARLVNRNPETGGIDGGDEQWVTSSGGAENAITRDVIGRNPGTFQVDVEVDEAEAIAAAYREELQRIAAELDQAASPLDGRVSADAVVSILDRTMADIERSLPFPELEAFRDAVRQQIDHLRDEAKKTSIATRAGAPIQLVAQRSSSARSFLLELRDFLFGASRISPLIEICVVTLPRNGATLLLYPQRSPDNTQRLTATRFPIYVGLYTWEISKRGYLDGKGTVNFLTDPDRVLECTLRHNDSDPNVCEAVIGNVNQRCGQ
jgi:hypothetical protein